MEIKTYRAKTMPQALALVRRELGPEAMVLHTRELNAGLLGRMFLGRQYEIAATPGAQRASSNAKFNSGSRTRSRGGLGSGELAPSSTDVATIATHPQQATTIQQSQSASSIAAPASASTSPSSNPSSTSSAHAPPSPARATCRRRCSTSSPT